MIHKALLNQNILGQLHYSTPSTVSTQHQFWEFKKQKMIKEDNQTGKFM